MVLDNVYHLVHIGNDDRSLTCYEERLLDLIQGIKEEVKLGVRSAIVFVDEPLVPFHLDITKIPGNVGRRKRIYNEVVSLLSNVPIISGYMSGKVIKKSELFLRNGEINFQLPLVQKILEIGSGLSSIGVDESTRHFVAGEYLGLCVNNYSDLIKAILGYKSKILEYESLSISDTAFFGYL